MYINNKSHIHSVERAGALESSLHYKFQNPYKILNPYIKPGMTVLDLGCGPGFFSTDIAKLLNGSGKVISADLQSGMLERARSKIQGTYFEQFIHIHKCQEESLNLSDKINFVIAFYSLHEIKYLESIIKELKSLLLPDSKVFISEQKFHVKKSLFNKIIDVMKENDFTVIERPKVFFSRSVVMKLK